MEKKVLYIIGNRDYRDEFILEQKIISKETPARYYFETGMSYITYITFINKSDVEVDKHNYFATFDASGLLDYLEILNVRKNVSLQKKITDIEKQMASFQSSAEELKKQLEDENDNWKIK